MANFPDNPTDGQQIVEPATDGTDRVAIWTYNSLNQQWTYELYEVYSGDTAIYTDQVIVRQPDPMNYPELTTQMDVNQLVGSELGLTGEYVVYTDQIKERGSGLTQAQINIASASAQNVVTQNVDAVQGTKSKGTWQFHGGPIPDDGVPAENQFWLADAEGVRTQDFCNASFVRIHSLGNQGSNVTKDRVVLGTGEVGDKLIIQDLFDGDGCKYTITSVELHDPDGEDYTKAYALYGVEADETYCYGSVAPAEIVSIRLAAGPTDSGESLGDFLPLTGGTISGQLSVAGNLSVQGDVLFPFARDKAFRVYDVQGGQVFSVYGDIFGAGAMYYGAIEQGKHVATKEYVDNSIGKIEIPEASLSTKDKLYLQGFYPFKFGGSTQIDNPGEFLVKDSSYLVTQDPEKWKYFYFSTTDAYGQDLAGQFLNHMHTESQYEGQVWIAKENGYKLCSYIGKMKVRDQNFERYFNLEMDNTRELLNPPHYDTQALRVDKGEVLWIKCSFWG